MANGKICNPHPADNRAYHWRGFLSRCSGASRAPARMETPGLRQAASCEGLVMRTDRMEAQTRLDLVLKLCQALETEGVAYCHWKSNVALDRSASGENDLDLLVGRADAQRFTETLSRLGFKEARVSPGRHLPGILDYYGYDSEADKWVHVHAHFQLILGDDMTKNYHLPIEQPFLDSAIQGNLFRIPAPEFELIVFVIRMVLKHSSWDAVLTGQGALPPIARRELDYLGPQVSESQINEILQQHLAFIDAGLFDRGRRSLQPDCPLWTRIKVGRQLQSRLRAHARRSKMTDTYLKLWRRVTWGILRYVFRQRPRKRMAAGGTIIAIVGGDGAGKSTAVDELYSWLSRNFLTIKVHLGKPPLSGSAFAVKGTLWLGRWLGLLADRKARSQSGADAKPPEFPGYARLFWHVLTARDRYRAYVKARRFATNGGLVVCDRYPLPQIKLMDGARIGQTINREHSRGLIKLLMRLEERYYQHIVFPDVLIVLKVNPEIAVQRRIDEDTVLARIKCQEVWELDWKQTPAHVLDSGRPKPQLLSDIKSLVWSVL